MSLFRHNGMTIVHLIWIHLLGEVTESQQNLALSVGSALTRLRSHETVRKQRRTVMNIVPLCTLTEGSPLLAREKGFTVSRGQALGSLFPRTGLSATKNSAFYKINTAFFYACEGFSFTDKHSMGIDVNVQSAVWINRAYFIHSEQTMVLRKDKGVYDSSAIFVRASDLSVRWKKTNRCKPIIIRDDAEIDQSMCPKHTSWFFQHGGWVDSHRLVCFFKFWSHAWYLLNLFSISDIDLFQDDSEDNVDDGECCVLFIFECVSRLFGVVWDSQNVLGPRISCRFAP